MIRNFSVANLSGDVDSIDDVIMGRSGPVAAGGNVDPRRGMSNHERSQTQLWAAMTARPRKRAAVNWVQTRQKTRCACCCDG